MSVKFGRTPPPNVFHRSTKIVRPLIKGTPRTIQFMESRIDKVGDYFIYFGKQAAEELTEKLREMAATRDAWKDYVDVISIEFDEDQFQFVLRAKGKALAKVRELELSAETIFTAIAGDHLTDQDNDPVVSSIKSGPIANVAKKVNNTVKKAMFLGSGNVSGETYSG
jgi:hypothetical protein